MIETNIFRPVPSDVTFTNEPLIQVESGLGNSFKARCIGYFITFTQIP